MVRTSLFMMVVWSLVSHSTFAQETTKKPWWNPFAQTESSSSSTSMRESSFFDQGSSEPLFRLPSFLKGSSDGTATTASAPVTKKPSTFSKIGSQTKRFWNGTIDFLNPFDGKTSNNKPAMYGQGYQPQSQANQAESGSRFGWLWGNAKPEEPASVNEFLRMPRPKF